ncbi:hypothetical protein Taro_056848, partial [Colocasia esculenta]|nr:hypothetical protein [Colocasia esculenta]
SKPPARPQFRIGTSTRSVKGRIRRFPVRRPNFSVGARSRAADAIAYGEAFAQTCITFRSIIGIAYKTTIRNQHLEALDAQLVPESPLRFIPTPSAKELGITFCTGIGIAYVTTIRNRHSETVDRALVSQNFVPVSWIWVPEHRRYSHPLRFIPTPSAKELGITFRTGIGIAYVTTIRNRHTEMVEMAMVLRNSVPGPKFTPGACIRVHRLSYPPVRCGYLFAWGSEPPGRPQFRIGTLTRSVKGRIRRFPVRRPNYSPGARSRAADAIAYGHPFAQTGITFRSIIEITYKTPIRNQHSGALMPLYCLRR